MPSIYISSDCWVYEDCISADCLFLYYVLLVGSECLFLYYVVGSYHHNSHHQHRYLQHLKSKINPYLSALLTTLHQQHKLDLMLFPSLHFPPMACIYLYMCISRLVRPRPPFVSVHNLHIHNIPPQHAIL